MTTPTTTEKDNSRAQQPGSLKRLVRPITDCAGEGCEECDVCKYLNALENIYAVAPQGSTIERNAEMDAYIARVYPGVA